MTDALDMGRPTDGRVTEEGEEVEEQEEGRQEGVREVR